jgi:hypothetical protein
VCATAGRPRRASESGRLRASGGGRASNYASPCKAHSWALVPTQRRRGQGLPALSICFTLLTAGSDEAFVGRGRPFLLDAFDITAHALYMAVTLLFYCMFRSVNSNLSLLAAIFGLVGCVNDVLGLFDLAPYKISSLAFFGPYCLLIGYLIDPWLPRGSLADAMAPRQRSEHPAPKGTAHRHWSQDGNGQSSTKEICIGNAAAILDSASAVAFRTSPEHSACSMWLVNSRRTLTMRSAWLQCALKVRLSV